MEHGLTELEKDVLDALAQAWNVFLTLPNNGIHDVDEFMRSIHALQNLVAMRVARRVNPDIWSH